MTGDGRDAWWREHASAELRDLLNEWDPIGVMAEPDWPRNEYDALIEPLRERLEAGTSEGELEIYLEKYVRGHMGLESDVDRESRLATRLVEWYAAGGGHAPR
jgi:hypothetical protein